MRGLIHRIVANVLLPLVFFHVLHYVTCQEELEIRDFNRQTTSAVSVIGITMLAMIIVISMVSCCLYNTFYSAGIEVVGHEVLNVRARHGLEKDVIEAFPSFQYSEVKGLKIDKGRVECAICLSEFEDEETLRWMPPCSHTFHANCIDVWLSSQPTCPVCRANLSLKPGESFQYPSMDVETGNSQSSVHESPESGNSETSNDNGDSKPPRSISIGLLSSWRMTEIFFPRSHSTGHSLVQLGENVDRYTLQLPEEVQRQLVTLNLIRRSQLALPRARSSRQGYRSGNVGTQRSGFPKGQQTLRRAISLSPPFSFQAAPVTLGKDNLFGETSQANNTHLGERSFERLMPDKDRSRKGRA